MHISLVPRHKVGENIFLPKRCVPFCEFFLVSVWYAYVHMMLVLDKRNRNERVSCFPALSDGLPALPSGSSTFSEILAVWCPVLHMWSLPPFLPRSIPFCPDCCPWCPAAPGPSRGSLFLPGLWGQRCWGCSAPAVLTEVSPWTDTLLFFPSCCRKAPFFFLSFKNQIWIWIFLFSLL